MALRTIVDSSLPTHLLRLLGLVSGVAVGLGANHTPTAVASALLFGYYGWTVGGKLGRGLAGPRVVWRHLLVGALIGAGGVMALVQLFAELNTLSLLPALVLFVMAGADVAADDYRFVLVGSLFAATLLLLGLGYNALITAFLATLVPPQRSAFGFVALLLPVALFVPLVLLWNNVVSTWDVSPRLSGEAEPSRTRRSTLLFFLMVGAVTFLVLVR